MGLKTLLEDECGTKCISDTETHITTSEGMLMEHCDYRSNKRSQERQFTP